MAGKALGSGLAIIAIAEGTTIGVLVNVFSWLQAALWSGSGGHSWTCTQLAEVNILYRTGSPAPRLVQGLGFEIEVSMSRLDRLL